MNPLRKFKAENEKDNPGEAEDEGDLWAAMHRCHVRIAVVDERTRMAIWIIVPILGFLVSIQLICLGIALA